MRDFDVMDLADRPRYRDIIAWHQWHQWGKAKAQKFADRQTVITLNSARFDNWHHAFIACEKDVEGPEGFLGTASLAQYDIDTRPDLTPWLASVYTMEAARHRGVGRKLVSMVEDLARSKGVETLWLYTPDKQHFYTHMGWEPVEPYIDKAGDTNTIMKKAL